LRCRTPREREAAAVKIETGYAAEDCRPAHIDRPGQRIRQHVGQRFERGRRQQERLDLKASLVREREEPARDQAAFDDEQAVAFERARIADASVRSQTRIRGIVDRENQWPALVTDRRLRCVSRTC
jgi:hypothetical protein